MSQRFRRQDDAGNQFNPEQPEDGGLNATVDGNEGMEEVEEQEGYSACHLFHFFCSPERTADQISRSLTCYHISDLPTIRHLCRLQPSLLVAF